MVLSPKVPEFASELAGMQPLSRSQGGASDEPSSGSMTSAQRLSSVQKRPARALVIFSAEVGDAEAIAQVKHDSGSQTRSRYPSSASS